MPNPLRIGLTSLATIVLFACSTPPSEPTASFRDLNNNGQLDIYENPNETLEARVDDIRARLSLEQKINLVIGVGFNMEAVSGSDKVPGAAGSTYAIPELGIPSLVLADGPAGLRIQPERKGESKTYYATAFPIATLLASSWDTKLVGEVGKAMGNEIKEYGVDLFLAPGMNIHYNPLAGRNYEYYSEDPLLSGYMASAIVNGVESYGVGTTIKHFVANNAETNRMFLNSRMSERAAREIYLRGFEIAVREAQPWAIMTSYNKFNDEHISQSKAVLTTVLRDEWGYEGLVMTDWFAGYDTAKQLLAGNDLMMPGVPKRREEIQAALAEGTLTEADLDKNITPILKTVLLSPGFSEYPYSDAPALQANAAIARRAASEGVVLLKNETQTLPLANTQKLAVFGNTSYELISGGTGSGDVNEAYTVSLVEGLKNNQFAFDQQLQDHYLTHIKSERAKQPKKKFFFDALPPLTEFLPDEKLLAKLVAANDTALITIGRNSGEFNDRPLSDFTLTAEEQKLIDSVSQAFHKNGKKVVVILNIGNVIETVSWRDKVDAILLPWQGGQEAGNALADVLSGQVNPSGRLPTTFPMQYTDVPSSKRFPGHATSEKPVTDIYSGFFKGHWSELNYEEGIYVGYRYYDKVRLPTAYEFGFGLSYTNFEFSDLSVKKGKSKGYFTVSLKVTNTGKLAGKDVVQLYISAPEVALDKPDKELKGFAKTMLLQPGQSETITFNVTPKILASFDTNKRAWVAEAGNYTFNIGNSSQQMLLTKSVRLPNELVAEHVKATLEPSPPVRERISK